tara:strand:- start:384 stop:566 length:183 start_codon:yes stop_codon:yes gene_type:complete
MSKVAVDTPFVDESPWHDPAQSLDRMASPFPPGFAAEIVADATSMKIMSNGLRLILIPPL